MKPLRSVGLLYTPLTKKALSICFQAHREQVDKGGMPYFIHPLHVAEQLETEEEICAALLHDVVEDTPVTLADLERAGFPEPVLNALRLLTHAPGTPYLKYVARVRRNPLARRVKLADLAHNSDLNRLNHAGSEERRRVLKYRMAQAILGEEEHDRGLGCCRIRLPLSLEHPLFLSVFYEQGGDVRGYSLDVEEASDSHYSFNAREGEKLCRALGVTPSLPELLAARLERSGGSFLGAEALLKEAHIRYQSIYYD